MPSGIEFIYTKLPEYCLPAEEIAKELRRFDPRLDERYLRKMGIKSRAVLSERQSPLTLAGDCIYELLEDSDTKPKEIKWLLCATETSKGCGWNTAWEIKGYLQAEYGIDLSHSIALQTQAACAPVLASLELLISRHEATGEKGIVVAFDESSYSNPKGKATEGVGACAMLVGEPNVLRSAGNLVEDSAFSPDWWRPWVRKNDPLYEGKVTKAVYMARTQRAMDRLAKESGMNNLLKPLMEDGGAIVFHTPTVYITERCGFLPRWMIDLNGDEMLVKELQELSNEIDRAFLEILPIFLLDDDSAHAWETAKQREVFLPIENKLKQIEQRLKPHQHTEEYKRARDALLYWTIIPARIGNTYAANVPIAMHAALTLRDMDGSAIAAVGYGSGATGVADIFEVSEDCRDYMNDIREEVNGMKPIDCEKLREIRELREDLVEELLLRI